MGRQIFDAQRIAFAGEIRHEVVNPALDVGLTHTDLDLLIEQSQHGQWVRHSAIDASDRDGASATNRIDGIEQGGQPVDAKLTDERLGNGVRQERGHLLREFRQRRAMRLLAYGEGAEPDGEEFEAKITSG